MRKFIFTVILAGCAVIAPSAAYSQATKAEQQKQVSEAVLKVYNKNISANPKDYNSLFRRAHHYYDNSQYALALDDINQALEYIPRGNSDLLSQAYALRANIYLMLNKKTEALPDITEAYRLDKGSYALLYQKANTEYELGNYKAAKEDYAQLGRLQPRSQESLIGLARIALKENNIGQAYEYADQAVSLFPADPDVYLRRASIRSAAGNNTGAVDDMLVALSLDPKGRKAIQSIVKMSFTDYNAVISALTTAIGTAADNPVFPYLRGVIAQAHFHYLAAIKDYKSIMNRNLYRYYGIYGSLAECEYALTDYNSAVTDINYAIGSTTNSAPYQVISSKIRLAMGQPLAALATVDAAIKQAPAPQAYVQRALCLEALERYDEANESLGEAIMEKPQVAEYYIIRAWITGDKLNKKVDAENYLNTCLSLDYSDTDLRSYRGFAYNLLGRNAEALNWIEGVLAANSQDVDGEVNYVAACLYSQMGYKEQAFNCLEKALMKGYSNLYNLRDNNVANLNLAPLRSEERFARFLTNYEFLFK